MASANLNIEVLAVLTQLADTLSRLNEHASTPQTNDLGSESAIQEITQDTANLALSNEAQTPHPTPVHLTHYRTQPPSLVEAYTHISTGAQYIHATSTKYTLVSKIDYEKEGGNLAVELRKGAELIAAATLTVFSPETGCGPSVKRYVKQFARGVIASVISLITSFEDGTALAGGQSNQIGPQKTGAVWSACDAYVQLPKGNRNAMRRECMTWVRDCMDSTSEFEEVMNLGEREDGNDEELTYEEEMYTAREMKIVKAAVNVMKCTKNVLGLVLKACDCVGDVIEMTNDTQHDESISHEKRLEMLAWINQLHERARSLGEGVTDFGILLYPPLELNNKASESMLAQQLNLQLLSLERCVNCIGGDADVKMFMSEEVKETVEKLRSGVKARAAEVHSSMSDML
ncbi:hypothetical protein ACHAXN_007496 [Cyclotella atomus]|jgi:hypothetical protein